MACIEMFSIKFLSSLHLHLLYFHFTFEADSPPSANFNCMRSEWTSLSMRGFHGKGRIAYGALINGSKKRELHDDFISFAPSTFSIIFFPRKLTSSIPVRRHMSPRKKANINKNVITIRRTQHHPSCEGMFDVRVFEQISREVRL